MPELVSVKVIGLDRLQRVLEEKPRNIAKKLLRRALLKAAAVIKAEMSARAPRLKREHKDRYPGQLADAVMSVARMKTQDIEGVVDIGVRRKKAWWASWMEFGIAHDRIKRNGKNSGKRMSGPLPAQPFMRPAFESKKNAALAAFVEEGRKIVAEESH